MSLELLMFCALLKENAATYFPLALGGGTTGCVGVLRGGLRSSEVCS